ncbi:hypothetical protein QJQ45_011444 [Haematococcus lacustris]|nr:hypothetical protein QJQ45_011444 [Haematococcus lacustris]
MVYACITWPASAPCLTCQVTVGEPDLQAALEQRISELCSAVERCPPAEVAQVWNGMAQLIVYAQLLRIVRVISLVVASPAVSLSRSALASGSERSCQGEDQSEQLREGMEAALTHITCCVSERRDHIPPVVSSATLTFPYDVTITWGGQRSAFSLSSVKKALLQASPPPMIG